MNFTAEQINKAKSAKSAEELLSIAKAENAEITEEEAKKYFEALNLLGELSDDELSAVAGGKGEEMAPTEPPYESKYKVGDTVWYDRDWYTVSAVWWNGSAWKYKITRYDINMGYDTRDRFSEDELLDHVPKEYM